MKLHILAAALVAFGLAGTPAQAAPDAQQASAAKPAKAAKKTGKKSAAQKKNTASSPAASRDDDEWSTFLRDDDGDPNIEVDWDCGIPRTTRKGEKRAPCPFQGI
ncbi:MAG: hypothetical protein J6T92_04670 [Ottowia sp.]|nr:hypothetical protein [Ottowia sp.]